MKNRIEEYTRRMREKPSHKSLYLYRSGEYTRIHEYEAAIDDAKFVIQTTPRKDQYQPKAHKRVGDAYNKWGEQNFRDSAKAYKKGLALDPKDEDMKTGLVDALAHVCSVFGDCLRNKMSWKLWVHPRTHEFVQNEEDVTNLMKLLGRDDLTIYKPKLEDQRVVQALGVLLTDQIEDMVVHERKGVDVEVAPEDEGNKAVAKAESKAGDKALSYNNATAAVTHYTNAISLTPNKHLLYAKRSHAHMRLSHYKEAVSDAKMSIQLNPGSKRGFHCLGAAYFAWGVSHFSEALNFYKKFPEKNKTIISKLEDYTPDPFGSVFQQDRINLLDKLKQNPWTSGFMKQADFYNKIMDLTKNPRCIYLYMTDDRVMRAVCVLLGAKLPEPDTPYKKKKKFQGLIDRCSNLISEDRTNYDMFAQRSRHHSSQKEYDQALRDGMMVLSLKPLCSEGYVLVGEAQHGLGLTNFKKSVEAYKKVLAINPTMVAVKPQLADALAYVSSPFGKALGPKMWKKLSENSRIKDFMKKTDFVQMMDEFSESPLHAKPKDVRVIETLLVLLSDRTKEESGPPLLMKPPQWYLEAAPQEETYQAQVQDAVSKGDAALSSGDFPGAVSHYTAAISLAPNSYVLFSKRSAAHTLLRHHEAALSDLKKTLQLKPSWVEGYRLLGTAHYQCGLKHLEEAVESYKKALAINPTKDPFKRWGLEELKNYAWNPFEEALGAADLFEKLNDNPRTSVLMKDRAFVDMMKELKQNPRSIYFHTSNTDLVQALYVLVNGEKLGCKKRRHRVEGIKEKGEEVKRSRGEARQRSG